MSWLLRDDPTKTAQDLGYDYLPQDVVTQEKWKAYTNRLRKFDFEGTASYDEVRDQECSTGACPIK